MELGDCVTSPRLKSFERLRDAEAHDLHRLAQHKDNNNKKTARRKLVREGEHLSIMTTIQPSSCQPKIEGLSEGRMLSNLFQLTCVRASLPPSSIGST